MKSLAKQFCVEMFPIRTGRSGGIYQKAHFILNRLKFCHCHENVTFVYLPKDHFVCIYKYKYKFKAYRHGLNATKLLVSWGL